MLKWLTLALVVSVKGQDKIFAHYEQTNILINTCGVEGDLQVRRPSILQCALACSQRVEYRRYSYCESNSVCSLSVHGTDCIMSGEDATCACFRKVIGYSNNVYTCPMGYYGNDCENVASDCIDAFEMSLGDNVAHLPYLLTYIQSESHKKPIEVTCSSESGGIVILSRVNTCLDENFNRSFTEYEKGFGNVPRNRWLGLQTILDVLNARPSTELALKFELTTTADDDCRTSYNNFVMTGRATGYTFSVDGMIENSCGDSITGQINLEGVPFQPMTTITRGPMAVLLGLAEDGGSPMTRRVPTHL